jgi:hypothetical protein
MRIVFLRDALDPAFPVVDRFRADVEVADDDDLAPLGAEEAHARGEGAQVV